MFLRMGKGLLAMKQEISGNAKQGIDIAEWAETAVGGLEEWSDTALWLLVVPKRVGTRRRMNFGVEGVFVAPWLLDDRVARDGLEFLVPGGDTSVVRDPRGYACQWRRGDEAMLIDPVSWTRTRVVLGA